MSLLCGYLTNQLLKSIPAYDHYSWIVDIPSSGIAYLVIFYQVFDKFVWRWLVNRKIWFQTPVISGTYTGQLFSSIDGKIMPTNITVKIEQTLSKIRISLSTQQSTSKSEMAAISTDETYGPLLIYEFLIDQRKVSDPNLTIHRGSARLTYNE